MSHGNKGGRSRRPLLLLLIALAAAGPATAQQSIDSLPGSELTVSLVTYGPGQIVWERFGHNALRIQDRDTGSDISYNYGMFDFAQPNFILNFVQGRMYYWMTGRDFAGELAYYRRVNRTITVQKLNLTPGEKLELRDFLEWNARPENRYYRYDYYLDNCSTRIRDALDRALDGRIRRTVGMEPSATTFRFHTARLVSNDPLKYTGMMLGLGQMVDRPITKWEEMFLPPAVQEYVRRVQVPGPGDSLVPLVLDEQVLYTSTAVPPPDEPPSWTLYFLAGGFAWGFALFALGRRRERRGVGIAFGALAALWLLLAGLAGLGLTGLWLLTDHAAAYHNENLFLFNPLSLILLAPVVLAALGRKRFEVPACRGAVVVAAIAAAGAVVQVLPGFYQVNGEFIALALPIHAGLVAGLWPSLGAASADRRARASRRHTLRSRDPIR